MSSIAPHAVTIRLAAEEAGDPIPEDCIPPALTQQIIFPYRAFWELSIGRSKPLSWITLDAYALRYGIIDIDAFERFCKIMRAVDNTWLTITNPQPEIFPDGH